MFRREVSGRKGGEGIKKEGISKVTILIQQSVNSGYLCLAGGLANGIMIFLFLLLLYELYNTQLKGGAFKGS